MGVVVGGRGGGGGGGGGVGWGGSPSLLASLPSSFLFLHFFRFFAREAALGAPSHSTGADRLQNTPLSSSPFQNVHRDFVAGVLSEEELGNKLHIHELAQVRDGGGDRGRSGVIRP